MPCSPIIQVIPPGAECLCGGTCRACRDSRHGFCEDGNCQADREPAREPASTNQ